MSCSGVSMSGMLAKILDVGTSIAALGNAARPAVPVPNIIGDACGTSDLAPSPGEGAPLEWLAGLTVDKNRADAGHCRQAVKLGDDKRIVIQVDYHFRRGFPRLLLKDAALADLAP